MKTTITIKGTHCASCKTLIEDVCADFKGAQRCTVDFESGKTVVEHTEDFDWNAFRKEVEELGNYKIDESDIRFTCSECGLQYKSGEIAKKCEAWCKEHKSCNLEIIKHAIQEK